MTTPDREHPVPPAGEEIHLPGPTLLPITCAAGITLIVVGTTTTLLFVIVGAVLFVASVVKWIAETRRDISELPLEHPPGH